RERHALARAAALRVDEQLGVRRLSLPALDVGRTDAGVDVAFPEPDGQLSTRHALEPDAEEHVGQEEDLAILRDRLDHGLCVSGGAAVVALRLHLGSRIHVRDDDRARVLGLPLPKLLRGDRRGEGAACVRVRDQHRLLGAEDRGSLGHEVDAAEDDRIGVRRGRLLREAQRVAHVIGHVLHLGNLVVVREDDGAALCGERTYLVLHTADLCDGHATSRETSRERAECVSAPTETKSTPVSAIARTVSSATPPDASSSARPSTSEAARASTGGGMLSSRIRSAPAASASSTWSRVSHSTSTGTPLPCARCTARAIEPATRRWLSLIRIASYRPK